ncbi:hypothetical protein [Clostridium lundense]|uniref:hypothetical protein n=1 Tax=Clostridium lundense TaxID=319475 RepID=UPI000485A246|nr:hypothetical protein [Clostridium lundense]
MKLCKNKWCITKELYTVKDNQKKYEIFQWSINEDIEDKLFNYNLNVKDFKSFTNNFYKEKLKEKFKIATGEETSFERIFVESNDISMNINDKIYLIVMFFDEINKTCYKNAIEDISIRIYLNFVDKCYKITKRTPKVLIKNTFDKNIFASIYNYLVTEIKKYEVLDDEDKVRKILNKYKVRVDFTKRKNSYAYTSNHIVLSKEVNLNEFLVFLEKGNSIVVENFLNYFPYYVLNIAEIRFRLHFYGINGKTLEQINNYYKEKRHKEPDLCYLLKELKPAKPRYIIDKLKSMKYVDINREVIENKECVKFSIDLNNRNVQKNYLMDIINSRGMLVYNYTNSHIKY